MANKDPKSQWKAAIAQQRREAHQQILFQQLKEANLPLPEVEYQFHPTRKFKADFAWPAARLVLEIEGGVYTQHGLGHRSITGYDAGINKFNELAILGWKLIRCTPDQLSTRGSVDSGKAIEWLRRYFAAIGLMLSEVPTPQS